MTITEHAEAILRAALPGDYGSAAVDMALRIQKAVRKGTGCRLTADQARALDIVMGDGDWWGAIRAIGPASLRSE